MLRHILYQKLQRTFSEEKKCVGGCSFIKESVCTREAEKCETSYLAMLANLRLASNTEYGIQGANPPPLFPCNA